MTELEAVHVDADWLKAEPLQLLFDLLCADGGDARVAGGAVRNTLMGLKVSDIDLATTVLPETVVERLEHAGQKAVPTGIDHGTVTAVVDGQSFEITTLREDIETDGRHAVVQFGTDWAKDAMRRDLTINGLYCDRDGKVYDCVDGYKDIVTGTIRFIGDAGVRIDEDALRILRFFRFFASYGSGRPDAAGLKACAAKKQQLVNLSAERVWMELQKLLSARDPGRALLWMRTAGILTILVPETEKWGIDSIPGLIEQEREHNWQPDALLRLMAMIRPDREVVDGLAKRLKLSNDAHERLVQWASTKAPEPSISESEFQKKLYRGDVQSIVDCMRLETVHAHNREAPEEAGLLQSLIKHAASWQKPEFPVTGKDLLAAGVEPGPEMGRKLNELEELWIESDFSLTRKDLLGSE